LTVKFHRKDCLLDPLACRKCRIENDVEKRLRGFRPWMNRNRLPIKLSTQSTGIAIIGIFLFASGAWILNPEFRFAVRRSHLFSVAAIADIDHDAINASRYEKPLTLPGIAAPAANATGADRFPGMIIFQDVAGDIGSTGDRAFTLLWYLPVFPPALFLSLAMTSGTVSRRGVAAKARRVTTRNWLNRIAWPIYYIFCCGETALAYSESDEIGFRTFVYSAIAVTVSVAIHCVLSIGRRTHSQTIRGTVCAFLIGVPFAAISVVVIADTHRMINTLDDHPPRLYDKAAAGEGDGELRGLIKDIRDALVAGAVPDTRQLSVIRQSVIALTPDRNHNIVSLNLARCAWYIVFAVAAAAVSVLGLRPVRRSFGLIGQPSANMRLLLVLTTYITVGAAFGVMYYDYYCLDAGRYHFLLETFWSQDPYNERQAWSRVSHNDSLKAQLEEVRTIAGGIPSLRSIIASGYFASSVFSQDSPEIALANNAPEAVEADPFSCTFQFDPDSSEIVPRLILYHKYSDAGWTSGSPGCPQLVRPAIEDNSTSQGLLKAFFCSELVARPDKFLRGYQVTAIGGADCSGSAPENDRYGGDRARSALLKARETLVQFRNTGHEEAYRELRSAFDTATPQTYAQRPSVAGVRCNDSAFDDLLWPHRVEGHQNSFDHKVQLHPARAAVLRVARRNTKLEGQVKTESGLSSHTTLSDMIYFSFTTTGYGDMKAVSGPVRFCVIVENILELLFTAIFFAAAMAVVTRE
jgi:hypothetical protein